jgi:hypothetical protein
MNPKSRMVVSIVLSFGFSLLLPSLSQAAVMVNGNQYYWDQTTRTQHTVTPVEVPGSPDWLQVNSQIDGKTYFVHKSEAAGLVMDKSCALYDQVGAQQPLKSVKLYRLSVENMQNNKGKFELNYVLVFDNTLNLLTSRDVSQPTTVVSLAPKGPSPAAPALPTWEPKDEPYYGSWDVLSFNDSQGTTHKLWCRSKECHGNSGTTQLFILDDQPTIEKMPNQSFWNHWVRFIYHSKLSQFALNPATKEAFDPRNVNKKYPVTFLPRMQPQGGMIRVLPPTDKAKDAPAVPKKKTPTPGPKPVQTEATATDIFKDPVEETVVRYLLDAESDADKKKAEQALLDALEKPEGDPARQALVKDWQKKVLKTVNDQLTQTNRDEFLKKTSLTNDQLLAYICPKLQLPSAASSASGDALKTLRAMVLDQQSSAQSNDVDGLKAGSATGFEASNAVNALCGKAAQNPAVNTPGSAANPNGSGSGPGSASDLSYQPKVPNVTTGGDQKPWLLNLDSEGKRDSAAFGIMTGGVFGLLAMGAAAGPAGLFAAVLIGGLIGFFGYAMSHPKKKKDDE